MDELMSRLWTAEVNSNGGTWSIQTVNGDVIADDIPHGEVAEYITTLHNEYLTQEEY